MDGGRHRRDHLRVGRLRLVPTSARFPRRRRRRVGRLSARLQHPDSQQRQPTGPPAARHLPATQRHLRTRRRQGLQLLTHTHTHTHTFNGPFPGLPGWAGTRKAKPNWILLKQETVSGSGISWAICKSAPRSRQITMPAPHHSVFTGRMPFLPPNQQRQSTEGNLQLLTYYKFCIFKCFRNSIEKIDLSSFSRL